MKKGFTLVEVLAVIVVLGAIGLIAITTITNSMKKTQEDLYNIQIGNIIEGARAWSNKYPFLMPSEEGQSVTVTLGQLKKETTVDQNIKNPKTNLAFDDNMEIKITKLKNGYDYQILE